MSTTTIKPTVGRVVWFYPEANSAEGGFALPVNGEPLAALVARVVDESASFVHLTVFDASGIPHARPYVQIIQEGQKVPEGGRYATWMPYQISQAKKAENEIARSNDPKVGAVLGGAMSQSSQLVGVSTLDYTRSDALNMALRTPGLTGHDEVLAAARAYQAHIEGEKTLPAPPERTAPGPLFPGYASMQPHQQRVVDEKCELDARLAKLIPFFDTPIFAALDEGEKSRLERQEEAMKAYSAILTERIAAFTAAAGTPA